MVKRDSNGPKYRIEIYEVDGGEAWVYEVHIDGHEVANEERIFLSTAVDEAIDLVMDSYEEEYDAEDEF